MSDSVKNADGLGGGWWIIPDCRGQAQFVVPVATALLMPTLHACLPAHASRLSNGQKPQNIAGAGPNLKEIVDESLRERSLAPSTWSRQLGNQNRPLDPRSLWGTAVGVSAFLVTTVRRRRPLDPRSLYGTVIGVSAVVVTTVRPRRQEMATTASRQLTVTARTTLTTRRSSGTLTHDDALL